MKTRRRLLASPLALMLLSPAGLQAQDQFAVPVGSRVRFRAPGVVKGLVTGKVVAQDEQALTVEVDRRQLLRVRRDAIGLLDVSTARTRQWKKGMLIGAGVGAAVVAASAHGTPRCQNGDGCFAPPPGAAFGALLGVMYGAGIGGLVKADRWSRVSPGHVQVSLQPAGRGIGASLSIRF